MARKISALAGKEGRAVWGWVPFVAACVVGMAVGWFLARWVPPGHQGTLWCGPFIPWGVGLALAAGVAYLAPRDWIDRCLAARNRRAAVIVLLAIFFVVEFAMAWLGYVTFRHHSPDIKLFVDIVQRSIDGHLFHWLTDSGHTESYLAHHWALQILLWLPAWMAWPDPRMLLLIQIAGYVAMAAAVYKLAAVRLGPGPWPLAITTAVVLAPTKDWALSPELGNAPFLAVLIVAAALCVHRDRPAIFVVVLIAIMMSREDAAVFAAVIAIHASWTVGWRRLGVVTAAISAVWLVVLLKAIMPSFTTSEGLQPRWDMYGWLGSPSAALSYPLGTTWRVVSHLLHNSVPSVAKLLAAFGILPFGAGTTWFILLGLLPAWLTASYPGNLTYHHSYPAIAIAAVMAVEGARTVDRRLPAHPRLKLAAVLAVPLTALLLHAAFGYSPLTRSFTWSEYWPTPHSRALWAALQMVPPGETLGGSYALTARLFVSRSQGCLWEDVSLRPGASSSELWCRPWNVPLKDSFILIDRPRPTAELQHLVAASPYGVVWHAQDIALFRRGVDPVANQSLARWLFGTVRDAMSLPRQVGSLLGDSMSRSGRAVRVPRRQEGFVAYGWYLWACPTRHELVVRLRADSRGYPGSAGRVEIAADQGTRVLASRDLDEVALDEANYRELVIPVTLTEAQWIEPRIHATGRSAFWIDSMALVSVTSSGMLQPPGESCAGPPLSKPSPGAVPGAKTGP